jgi:hypothetical protein
MTKSDHFFCAIPEPPTEIELIEVTDEIKPSWCWRVVDEERWRGPFDTQDAALADARKELDE